MDPSAIPELELYTNCILCAACFGSCPVDGKESRISWGLLHLQNYTDSTLIQGKTEWNRQT